MYGTIPFRKEGKGTTNTLNILWKNHACTECGDMVIARHAMGTGNMKPEIMIIGEAPGVADGERKLERVMGYGPTSIFLRKALLHNKLLFKCWFTNLLKCALPNNENISNKPFKKCLKYLETEISILEPKKILLLGKNVQRFIEDQESLYSQIYKKVFRIYHPSYCLYKGIDYKTYGNKIREVLCQQ